MTILQPDTSMELKIPEVPPKMCSVSDQRRLCKRVRFCGDVLVQVDDGRPRDMYRLWYSRVDYARFRHNARRTCKNRSASDAESDDKYTYTRVMELVLDACQNAGCGEEDGITNSASDSVPPVLAPQLEDLLQQCVQHVPELYGLHRHCVKNLSRHKTERYTEIAAIVTGAKTEADGESPIERIQRITRSSRLFARLMAHAAAKAA